MVHYQWKVSYEQSTLNRILVQLIYVCMYIWTTQFPTQNQSLTPTPQPQVMYLCGDMWVSGVDCDWSAFNAILLLDGSVKMVSQERWCGTNLCQRVPPSEEENFSGSGWGCRVGASHPSYTCSTYLWSCWLGRGQRWHAIRPTYAGSPFTQFYELISFGLRLIMSLCGGNTAGKCA